MIWGAAAVALVLGLGLGLIVHRWVLLLIPLVPYAGMVALAVTHSGPTGGADWSHALPVAFFSGTAPMALGIAIGIARRGDTL